MTVTISTTPDAATIAEFQKSVVRVVNWVDIYESDDTTAFALDVPVESGRVTVDMNRSERRNMEVSILDIDGSLSYGPGNFWYDKVLRAYRGIEFANGDQWVAPLGRFIPDKIGRPRFPNLLRVSCRDISKRAILAKFSDTTTFAAGTNVGTVVASIATNGGLTDQNFTATTKTLAEDVTFEPGDSRWQAMIDLAKSIGNEVFIDASGDLIFRPFPDPTTGATTFSFTDDPASSNLVDWNRSTSDNFLFNDIIVYGTDPANSLVWAQAENTTASSPTRIAAIGRRTETYPSKFVADNTTAQDIADKILSVSALEQFDMSFTSLMLPWLEVGEPIEIDTLDADPGDPTRFLLANLNIELGLAPMTGMAKRVTTVG